MYPHQRKTLNDHELEHRIAVAILGLRLARFRYLRSFGEGLLRLEGRERFVDIDARNGEVRLVGQVTNEHEKSLLEEAAPRVDGVVRFTGHIQIAATSARRAAITLN